ncbi:related to class V chitinase [Rhynchosporium graminicola]|uniref:chitinase n=1 Tax=Rhynchosporium graminicola TaxID=2792576 RepID=A0A1E1LQ92_9HELO|nr:related to class V chitinase [Rhynchosporium commune]
MKYSLASSLTLGLSALQVVNARYVMYVDQFHLTDLPNKTVAAGIDTVIMAFANSSLFVSPAGNYTPFEPVSKMRSRFDEGTKILIALGGWGDTDGFSAGAATEESRADFAKNVANMVNSLGFDGADMDFEYPGGNGADYKQKPNSSKVSQIETWPLLLAAIRAALGKDKLLSIAAPALQRDMIAYTPEKAAAIFEPVDFVNIMTYDLITRRDNMTKHHTDVAGSLAAVEYYLDVLHLPPVKANLGFAFYAKYFSTDPAAPCETGLGCETVLLEDENGKDTGKSGALTFEIANLAPPPTNLTVSPDGSCGAAAGHFCPTGECCSAYGFCGTTAGHCSSCLADYGKCDTVSISTLFKQALGNGTTDEVAGGEYHFDKANNQFWTWDTPDLIHRKFEQIVKAKNLGGVMAWSAGEDSYDWSRILALQAGVAAMKNSNCP